jgi:transposase
MLTIVWGLLGFMSSSSCRRGEGSFNASYDTTEILSDVVRWHNKEPGTAGQKLIVHSDNARPHTARQTRDFIEAYGMEQAPHPPYSPDTTPSDFYLFDYVKDRLQRQHFEDGDQLFDAIIALAGTIERVTLQREFLEWMEGLRRCIDANDEYVGGCNYTVKKGECSIHWVSIWSQLVEHPISRDKNIKT